MSDPYGIYVDHDENQASSFTSFQIVLALTNSHIFWKTPRVCTAALFCFCSVYVEHRGWKECIGLPSPSNCHLCLSVMNLCCLKLLELHFREYFISFNSKRTFLSFWCSLRVGKIKPGILANLNGEEHLTAVCLSEHVRNGWKHFLICQFIAVRCKVMLIGAYFGICCHPLFWHLCPYATLISRKKIKFKFS